MRTKYKKLSAIVWKCLIFALFEIVNAIASLMLCITSMAYLTKSLLVEIISDVRMMVKIARWRHLIWADYLEALGEKGNSRMILCLGRDFHCYSRNLKRGFYPPEPAVR